MLIAVDTNVLFDHANDEADVVDAVATIRERLPRTRFVVTPTALEELFNLFERGDSAESKAARRALTEMDAWGFEPLNLIAAERGIVEQIGLKLRMKGVLPDEENNDSHIVAEAALLGCTMLLSADAHLQEAQQHPLFRKTLRDCDVDGDDLAIASPRQIVRRFFRRK